MIDLQYYAYLPTVRNITKNDYKDFEDVALNPSELLDLKEMNQSELRGLMMFCGVRVFNDTPIVACTKEEMRMAYITWRSNKVAESRVHCFDETASWAKKILKLHRQTVNWFD